MGYADRRHRHGLRAIALCTALTACTTGADTGRLAAGASYVALGSSFAAGPGVTTSADQPPDRCARSADNYAHLLARRRGLRLTDVSCSGATTAHILDLWNTVPAQVDAVTADTRLVTVTIGGNDVGYIGTLGSASCRSLPSPPAGAPGGRCPEPPAVSPATWTDLDVAMRRIVAEVRRRAPAAQIVFVDYLTVLPSRGTCAATPLPPGQADASRETARRLADLTARIAAQTHAGMLGVAALSAAHDACSAAPWINGFPLPGGPSFVPYHPNAQGMAAVADALDRYLGEPHAG